MARNIEEKIVFCLAPIPGDSMPMILLGIPEGAWDYMKEGKTHHFDLSSIGMPIKLMLFGAKDHSAAMRCLEEAAKAGGISILDKRNKDFSIKPPLKEPAPE